MMSHLLIANCHVSHILSSEQIIGFILCKLEINKNLKFKKGVGFAIKSKETSSKLAI